MSANSDLPSLAHSSSNILSEADQIRSLLKQANLSQRAAAKYLNIDERTMRAWCAGDGKPPPLILKALEFRAAYPASLMRMIESNERTISAIQDGRILDLRNSNDLEAQANLLTELERLKKLNEEHRALLRMDIAFHSRQEAYLRMNEQWFPHGNGAQSEGVFNEFDAAEQEFHAAKADCDRIASEIRKGKR
ncbi:Cro/C1-type helix-turn-helix domain [Oxalobacteraceae bacterium]